MDPYHYLPALLRKPRAFHQARAVRGYPWPPTFRQALAFLEERHPDVRGIKEFLRILTLKDRVGEERLSRALELACSTDVWPWTLYATCSIGWKAPGSPLSRWT